MKAVTDLTITAPATGTPGVLVFHVCACCLNCSDLPLASRGAVVCRTCGGTCSCQGCIAEAPDA